MPRPAVIAAAALALTLGAPSAWAKPEYAAKEGKPCAFCHVNPNGGGERNARGKYYAAHNYSLVGLDEALITGQDEPKKSGPPAYVSLWKVTDLPAGIRRASIGYVVDEKLPRVITWGEGNKIEVHNLSGEKPVVEASAEVGPGGARMAVVRRPKSKMASIVVPGAVYVVEGGKLVKKAAPDIAGIHGVARFADGAENVFFFDGAQVLTWAVDPSAEKMLSEGREMVTPDQASGVYADVWSRLPEELMGMLGWPEEVVKSGILGMIDVRGDSKVYAWAPLARADGNYLIFVDAMQVTLGEMPKPTWQSPKLAGKVLDVASGVDPKGGKKRGLLLLLATGEDGKGRALEFMALD